MNLSRYLIQSLDQGAYTLIDRGTRVCYMLMVNSIMGALTNIQLTILAVSPSTEARDYAYADRETFVFRFFASSWEQVESMIRSVLFTIINDDVDLGCPTELGACLGGLVNGEPVVPFMINSSDIH